MLVSPNHADGTVLTYDLEPSDGGSWPLPIGLLHITTSILNPIDEVKGEDKGKPCGGAAYRSDVVAEP